MAGWGVRSRVAAQVKKLTVIAGSQNTSSDISSGMDEGGWCGGGWWFGQSSISHAQRAADAKSSLALTSESFCRSEPQVPAKAVSRKPID